MRMYYLNLPAFPSFPVVLLNPVMNINLISSTPAIFAPPKAVTP